MLYGPIPPLTDANRGTLDPSQFSRTGSAYTNPEFLQLYMAQLDKQAFDTLFGEEGMNNSIFGDSNSSIFGTTPTSTDPLFGGTGASTLPSDIAGSLTNTGGSQYMEMIAQSGLIGKTVQAMNPQTKQMFTGKVNSVSVENGILLIDVAGIKISPEYLIKITQ
jgi:hypothetical protein